VIRLLVAAAVLVLGVAVVGTTRGVEGERYIAANASGSISRAGAGACSRSTSITAAVDGWRSWR
jgi:hypothetical protein